MLIISKKEAGLKRVIFQYLTLILLTVLLVFSCDEEADEKIKMPVIKTHPAGASWNVFSTDSINLSVTANSSDALSYQWYKNDSNSIEGSEKITVGNTTLTLEKEDFPVNGFFYFYVTVTNKAGSKTSNIACVNVFGNPDYGFAVSPLPEMLKNVWVAGENQFTITGNEITINRGTSAQTGTIESHRSNTAGTSGFITIKHTANDNHPNHNGSFYVIYYENLKSTSVKIAGARKDNYIEFDQGGTGGKATKTEAEAIYTLSDGFFEDISFCGKKGEGDPINHKFNGAWTDDLKMVKITLTNTTITYEVDMTLVQLWIETVFEGELVDYADNGNSGYLVFKYTQISETFREMHEALGVDLAGTYSVLVWENYNGAAANVSFGMDWYLEDWFTYGLMLTKEDAIAEFADGEYYHSLAMFQNFKKK